MARKKEVKVLRKQKKRETMQGFTRGLYQSKAGTCIHADINGALNTLEKSKVVEWDDNLKVKTSILLEVQKRKVVASRIAQWVRQSSMYTRFVGACSTMPDSSEWWLLPQGRMALFRKGSASGETIVRCQY